jgi:hypothetical protein
MRKGWIGAAAAAATLACAPAHAQVWTPTFQSTERGHDVGIYLSSGPGDLAVEGIWRRGLGLGDLGLRAGFADVGNGDLLLGADWRQPLNLGTAPVDLMLTFGAQGAVGDASAVGAQVGLDFGHTFTQPGVRMTPYVHPRLAVGRRLGGRGARVDVLADLGVDVDFAPNLSLRVGANLSDDTSVGVGLAWRR